MATSLKKAEKILRHGLKLQKIFPRTVTPQANGFPASPVALYKRLHRLEAEAHRLAERQCNENLPEDYVEKKDASILKRLDAILGFSVLGIPVFVNGDPRGYALKIDDSVAKNLDIEKDWGGYGLICPEF